MALSGLKIGQRVAWNGHTFTVWEKAPAPRQWWLYQHPEEGGGSPGFVCAKQGDMFPPTNTGLKLSIARMNGEV